MKTLLTQSCMAEIYRHLGDSADPTLAGWRTVDPGYGGYLITFIFHLEHKIIYEHKINNIIGSPIRFLLRKR